MCFSGKIFRREMLLRRKSDEKIVTFPEEVFSDKLVKLKVSVCRL